MSEVLPIDTYLVRHGRYDDDTGEITQQGVRDAEMAAGDLEWHGLGGSALILSSDTPRALGTAAVIADRLSIGPVLPSRRMNEGGNLHIAVKDLDQWIVTALDEAGASIEDKSGLIVVTHEPLIQTAVLSMDGIRRSVRNGSVTPYRPGSWNNPQFMPDFAARIETRIQESLEQG